MLLVGRLVVCGWLVGCMVVCMLLVGLLVVCGWLVRCLVVGVLLVGWLVGVFVTGWFVGEECQDPLHLHVRGNTDLSSCRGTWEGGEEGEGRGRGGRRRRRRRKRREERIGECQNQQILEMLQYWVSEGEFCIGGCGCVLCQFIEPVTFVRCTFIFALHKEEHWADI